MADLKVSLPTPCSEKWEAMSPRGCNRHCAACDTVIHDLSLITVEEAEALLDSGDEVCVKASVRRDGSIRTAPSRTSKSRRMVATIGASISLATAACQTPQITPRHELTGQVREGGWRPSAELVSATGKTYSVTIRGDQKFRFTNLRPGNYTLNIHDCAGTHTVSNIAVQDDLNLGEIDLSEVSDCIIIGKLMRVDDVSNG